MSFGRGGGVVSWQYPFIHAVPKGQGGASTPHRCASGDPMKDSYLVNKKDNTSAMTKSPTEVSKLEPISVECVCFYLRLRRVLRFCLSFKGKRALGLIACAALTSFDVLALFLKRSAEPLLNLPSFAITRFSIAWPSFLSANSPGVIVGHPYRRRS